MANDTTPELTDDELQAEGGEELPDREAMSLVNANIAIPVNAAIAANVLSDGAIAYADADPDRTHRPGHLSQEDEHDRRRTPDLTPAELDAQTVEELPDREAMSLINANLAAPVNAAVAANILSDNSVAYANAEQNVDITQST